MTQPLTPFTEEQVREIRECAARGETKYSLAKRFGVRKWAIRNIILRQTWKHVA